MSHEKTTDIEVGGRHYLLPTVLNGKAISPDSAYMLMMAGKLRPLAQASTSQDIQRMAKDRSNSFGASQHQSKDSGFLMDFLDSLATGFTHSAGQIKDDASRLLEGDFGRDIFNRLLDVAGELPGGKLAKKVAGNKMVGDVAKGIFGPIRTKQQKKVAKGIFRADPDTFGAVAADPRTMNIRVPMNIPYKWGEVKKKMGLGDYMKMMSDDLALTNYGQYTNMADPAKGGSIAVNPRVLRGMKPDLRREAVFDPESNLPLTALHEATHFLNVPEIYSMNDKQAAEFAEALLPALKPHGRRVVQEKVTENAALAADEALAYLAEAGRAKTSKGQFLNPDANEILEQLKVRPKPGGKGTFRLTELPQDRRLSYIMDWVMDDAAKIPPEKDWTLGQELFRRRR